MVASTFKAAGGKRDDEEGAKGHVICLLREAQKGCYMTLELISYQQGVSHTYCKRGRKLIFLMSSNVLS